MCTECYGFISVFPYVAIMLNNLLVLNKLSVYAI
ncbi:hypothetical protein BX604_4075 [Burkholderia sp. JKS000303]|nr:hypothetical protein BX604_4075 [Burkholderia sp. JKS000303]